MKTEACPKCGSMERELGQIFVRSTHWDIAFKADSASMFRRKKQIEALACSACGYLELFLWEQPGRDAP